uniref:PRONE domain-containing protein n=1 Tax=Kalanchoe fedtschenkoi TaxID=63787 RepID=A0A7N0TYU1_KALFE
MMMMRSRLNCCSRGKELSLDFDEKERIMTYDGLGSILGNHCFENESKGDGCPTDSLDDDSSCCSSKDVSGSITSKWTMMNDEKHHEWGGLEGGHPRYNYLKGSPCSNEVRLTDVEFMKERFSRLLLGEDVTGGRQGVSTAVALSNAITNLGVSIFGEMWKLEPLSEEKKRRWKKELNWFLSPTNYMVELVPALQSSADGCTMEIMTPKARADIHMNLPALQQLDSMLIDMLDSMVNTEFWYDEGGSRAEGRGGRPGQKWWLPLPQVPGDGLSDSQRKKLMNQGRIVLQVFKAVKSINDSVLLTMPVPAVIRDALPKTGKECLGEELYSMLSSDDKSHEEILDTLNLKSEQNALEVANKLEAASFAWREKLTKQVSGSSPVRTSWSFLKDPVSEIDKRELHLEQAELLLQALKSRFPNLPQTFLNAAKVKYGKDVGLAIMEAYSRVLANLAFSILSRIGEILQEDVPSSFSSPSTAYHFPGSSPSWMLTTPSTIIEEKHLPANPLLHRRDADADDGSCSDLESPKANQAATPVKKSASRLWRSGKKSGSRGVLAAQ